MELDDSLAGVTKLGIDTAPIIYLIEANPGYDALVTEVFRRIDQGVFNGITSVITLCEVLTHPIRYEDTHLQQEYRDLLFYSANFQTLSIHSAMSEEAARLRARYNLRTPDAFQVAVALVAGCEAFLTNDTTLKRVDELRILVLDEIVISRPE